MRRTCFWGKPSRNGAARLSSRYRLSYELIFQNEARNDVGYWRILEANRGNRMSNNNDTSNWWALLAVPFMAAGCFVQLLIMGFVLFVAVSVFLWFVGLF